MNRPQPSVRVPGPRLPKQRGSALSRVLLWTFLLAVFLGIAALALGFMAHSEYTTPGPLAEKRVFLVEQGQSATEIGTALERSGIITNGRIFAAMAQLTGQRTRLKAGEYEFPARASMQDVLGLIASGRAITYRVSIPEGFTSEMAVARVNAHEMLAGPPAVVPPEGTILPATYVFRRGMTRQKLVDQMQAAQQKLLERLWENRADIPAIQTPEQAVILASIVEKETAVAEERPIIASVFINRLNKGMRLQSDPTIIYGIVGGKGRLDRPLTRTDIETFTPYNTYRINGLPPGPIANPGREAIEAVLNPTPTEHLFFVADGTGGHAFAATLEEHNRNVRRWREIAGNAAAAAAAAAEAEGTTAGTEPAPGAAPEAPAGEAAPVPAPQAPAPAAAAAAEGPLAAVTETVAPQPAPAAPAAPETPAAPAASETPAAPAETEAQASLPRVDLAPGTIVVVDGQQAVIPRLRPAR